VEVILTEPAMNCDEVGSSKWPDRRPRNVIISYRDTLNIIEFPVPRWQKCISCLVAIWIAGDPMTIFLVIHRGAIDIAIREKWWVDGYDFSLRLNDAPSVTQKTVKEHTIGIFLQQLFIAYQWSNQKEARVLQS
jgi:hypothetical protein